MIYNNKYLIAFFQPSLFYVKRWIKNSAKCLVVSTLICLSRSFECPIVFITTTGFGILQDIWVILNNLLYIALHFKNFIFHSSNSLLDLSLIVKRLFFFDFGQVSITLDDLYLIFTYSESVSFLLHNHNVHGSVQKECGNQNYKECKYRYWRRNLIDTKHAAEDLCENWLEHIRIHNNQWRIKL